MMKPETFVVLLISVSGTVAEGNAITSKPDPINLINDEILGNTLMRNDDDDDDDETKEKPTKDDPNKDYHYENYYGHIIRQGLKRLKLNNQEYSIEASIKIPNPHLSEMAVEGTIKFDGMHSLRVDMTRVKRFENGDRDLLAAFKFRNISGIGNFSGLNSLKESRNYVFQFHPSRTDIEVFFMMTKDPSRKRVAFKFAEPQHYEIDESRNDLNVTLLLQQKASIVFHRLFNDLYNIIYERVFLTARINSPHFDTVLDNVFNKFIRNFNPIKSRVSSSQGNEINRNSKIGGIIFSRDRAVMTRTGWKFSSDGPHSLSRMSKVQVIKEVNGDLDLQTTIQFGNVSGNGRVFHWAPEITIDEAFTFRSTPVLVEAFVYLPRKKSFRATSMLNILTKPNYTIHLHNESFRNTFQLLLKRHELKMYSHAFNSILHKIAVHNEVFPKTRFTKPN